MMLKQQFHNFIRLLMIDQYGSNIQCWLTRLGFETIDNGVTVLF